ncbi:Uncharacterized protein FWK35_00017048 [Aphis craccivora]|uniref:Uncharacterized protein n=1 Tax=Aphis craccivora TaxID=307492 RepID=A0A6G0X6D3_APHCR|nr:Uncharacterized protein FWK35_00017048 [Aphis craccivora]
MKIRKRYSFVQIFLPPTTLNPLNKLNVTNALNVFTVHSFCSKSYHINLIYFVFRIIYINLLLIVSVAIDIAFALAKAKSSVVHPGGAKVHCSKWSSDWSSPHSHNMSDSFWYPHFLMFTFVFATPVLNLFNVFHIIQGWFSPHGKCSAGGTDKHILHFLLHSFPNHRRLVRDSLHIEGNLILLRKSIDDYGDIQYEERSRLLNSLKFDCIYIKGEQKKQLLIEYIPHVAVVNIDDLGCPRLDQICDEGTFPCSFHKDLNPKQCTFYKKMSKL